METQGISDIKRIAGAAQRSRKLVSASDDWLDVSQHAAGFIVNYQGITRAVEEG